MFTAKLVYGLKALLQIAKDKEKPCHIQELAKNIHAPVKYLEQVLAALGKARILTAKRGVGGGYWIARSPLDVKLDEIVRILEGKGHEGMLCPAGDIQDGVDDWLSELSGHIAKRLEQTSLQDLIDRENLLHQDRNTMYYI